MDGDIHYQFVSSLPVDAVIELFKEAHWWHPSKDNRKMIPGLISGSFCFLAVFSGEKLIGMGRVISDGASDAYIQDVIIDQDYRHHGIGTELVRRLRDYCVERGIGWLGLIAEPNTASFYEPLGFLPLKDYQPLLFGKGKDA
jgi:ribosomal protein S18 acetylase RimI-like enzyme